MLWTTEYLARITLEAEIEISRELNCIIDRYSIGIEQFQAEYVLPDYITNIRRILWKGYRLDPVSGSRRDEWPATVTGIPSSTVNQSVFDPLVFGDAIVFDNELIVNYAGGAYENTAYGIEFDIDALSVLYGPTAARPMEYYYSGFGENTVRFNPVPNEYVGYYGSGLYGINIPNAVVVEFYRVADGVNFLIPEYIRRRTIKCYVLMKAFQKEGDGQNLKAAGYWTQRYTAALTRAKFIVDNIYRANKNARGENFNKELEKAYLRKRGPLPSNYGIPLGYGDYD